MTLTRRQFKKLRNSCLHKAPYSRFLVALVECARLQLFVRPGVKRDRTKVLEVYKCDFGDHFHVGHKGSIAESRRPAFHVEGKRKHRKIVLASAEIL